MKLKQVIVIRENLEMTEGKKIVQACHASVEAFVRSDEKLRTEWRESGSKKVIVSSEELEDLRDQAASEGIPHSLIRDAGRTELESGTVTALGMGPTKNSKIDKITGSLGLIE